MKQKFCIILVLLFFSCTKKYDFQTPKHTSLLGLNGNVKSIKYEIFMNEITEKGYVPTKRVIPNYLVGITHYDLIFNNAIDNPFTNNGFEVYNNRTLPERNFCSIYDFNFNEDGYITNIIGKNPKSPDKNFIEEYLYNLDGKVEKIIKKTFDNKGNASEFWTNFYYNKSNLVDSIEIFDPQSKYRYAEKFTNYDNSDEKKINFNYKKFQHYMNLNEALSIQELKFNNRNIKYNPSGYITYDMISEDDGQISKKKEISYNDDNFIINYVLTNKNSPPDFLNFKITRNNLNQITKIVDLSNSAKNYQNLNFSYENDCKSPVFPTIQN